MPANQKKTEKKINWRDKQMKNTTKKKKKKKKRKKKKKKKTKKKKKKKKDFLRNFDQETELVTSKCCKKYPSFVMTRNDQMFLTLK